MNNDNQIVYNIYTNIDEFYKYRKLVSLDDKLSQIEFNKQIQKDKYIILKSVKQNVLNELSLDEVKNYVASYNEKTKDKNIYITYILLIYIGTEAESKRGNMIKLLNHIRYPKAETLIITPTQLSSSIQKYITSELKSYDEHKYRVFKPYTYDLLKSIRPTYELVPKFTILNEEEIEELKKNYFDVNAFSKVDENDVQMVWIGAVVGDIIKYEYLSETTIYGIDYSIVISSD
jgi:DNA-directed RNA polymerase subunit H (RpoH/RPB5)